MTGPSSPTPSPSLPTFPRPPAKSVDAAAVPGHLVLWGRGIRLHWLPRPSARLLSSLRHYSPIAVSTLRALSARHKASCSTSSYI